MPNYAAYFNGNFLGVVNAIDLNAAMAIAVRTYGKVTSIHLTDTSPPIAINDQSKQYFIAHCEHYFKQKGLENIQWDKLSKEDLYRIYVWSLQYK